MNLAFNSPERVPAAAVARLLNNMTDLLNAMDLAAAPIDPADKSFRRLDRAIALLRQEQADLQVNATSFREGNREPLLQHAADLRLLAYRTDGYFTDALQGDLRTVCVEKRQLLVFTAWQIAAVASGSEAAGL